MARAKGVTDNPAGVVETLLADYVDKAESQLLARRQAVEACIAVWNDFDERVGSFANEHSTL